MIVKPLTAVCCSIHCNLCVNWSPLGYSSGLTFISL